MCLCWVVWNFYGSVRVGVHFLIVDMGRYGWVWVGVGRCGSVWVGVVWCGSERKMTCPETSVWEEHIYLNYFSDMPKQYILATCGLFQYSSTNLLILSKINPAKKQMIDEWKPARSHMTKYTFTFQHIAKKI